MKRFIISAIFLSLVGSLIAQGVITIPAEIQSSVTPAKGAFYTGDPSQEKDIYYYIYEINAFDLNMNNDTKVYLEIYNPEDDEWIRVNEVRSPPVKILKDTTVSFEINLKDYFDVPFLGNSSYRVVLDESKVSKEFLGPNIVVNFGKENYEKLKGNKNLYDYSVEVRSSEPLLPIYLYVTKDGQNWIKYGLPQTYTSANSWKKLVWHNVPYFSKVEFRAKIK